MYSEIEGWFRELQGRICSGLKTIDPSAVLVEDDWKRQGGGGGLTKVFKNGEVIEKGGVNFSAVHGDAPDFLLREIDDKSEKEKFFATGVSIVLHPVSPEVPIIHMNVRYFEAGKTSWFGGGIDLTPHYVVEEDAGFFHSQMKQACDRHDDNFYERYKKRADDYFFLPHRNETRGVGGIFFDHLQEDQNHTPADLFEFVKSTGEAFLPTYSELVARNRDKKFSENERRWQRLRRGRYVEFNLIYDRGTRFGLETNGRAESILMSLPPLAEWEYDFKPATGTREKATLDLLKKGIDWIH